MKIKLVQIGNSRGIRIPKAVIQQMGLNGTVEAEIRGTELVLRAPVKPKRKSRTKNPRAGWDKAMREAVRKHGNKLSQEDLDWMSFPNDFDKKEWTW